MDTVALNQATEPSPWVPTFAWMTCSSIVNREREPVVYILASRRHGTLYIGVTSDLPARIHAHREGLIPGFTRRYGIKQLVHFERFDTMDAAIQREKRLKEWRRAWKIELIEATNPHRDDLAIGSGFPRLPA